MKLFKDSSFQTTDMEQDRPASRPAIAIAGMLLAALSGCGRNDVSEVPHAANSSGPVDRASAKGTADTESQPAGTMTNSIGLKLARIPAGEFLMGSADADPDAREDEKPQHRVCITRPFYMGVYEVTQAEFQGLMETNPSSFTREGLLKDAPPDLDCARLPVDNVTWYAAVEFCRRLSKLAAEEKAERVY